MPSCGQSLCSAIGDKRKTARFAPSPATVIPAHAGLHVGALLGKLRLGKWTPAFAGEKESGNLSFALPLWHQSKLTLVSGSEYNRLHREKELSFIKGGAHAW